jgi:hypothetical protein
LRLWRRSTKEMQRQIRRGVGSASWLRLPATRPRCRD